MFVTFEGTEGSGKTTQCQPLQEYLVEQGHDVLWTREPGGTSIGQQVREVLFDQRNNAMTPEAEFLLFSASRAQLVREVIKPHLKRGGVVVCDRFFDSSLAYQGYGHGLELATVRQVIDATTNGFESDIVVFLDSSPDLSWTRKKGQKGDRFDSEDTEFHNRVRNGYLDLASKDPHRWMVVDAGLPIEQVADQIWERVATLIASER